MRAMRAALILAVLGLSSCTLLGLNSADTPAFSQTMGSTSISIDEAGTLRTEYRCPICLVPSEKTESIVVTRSSGGENPKESGQSLLGLVGGIFVWILKTFLE